MNRRLIKGALLLALSFVFAELAKADDIHLCDVSGGCSAGSLIATTSTTAYATGKSAAGDTLFLAFLAPLTDNSGNFNSTTNLWGALGESPSQVFPNLASAISQLSGATGFVAQTFNATDLEVGPWTGSATINLPNLAPNTIIMGFVEDAHGDLSMVTPWSSSLATTTVSTPEPASLALLGIGLLGVPFFRRRRK